MFTLEQATKLHLGVEVNLYSFFNLSIGRGWVINPTPRRLYSPEKVTQHPFYRRLDGPQGRSGRVGKCRPPLDSIPGPPSP